MTTVGFGDITPKTQTGKIVIMFAAVLGIIQVSFVVNIVKNIVSLDDNEKNAMD